MKRHGKIEAAYVSNDDAIGGSCTSLDSYTTVFPFPEQSTRNYTSNCELLPQLPHALHYHNPLLDKQDPSAQFRQSVFSQDHWSTISDKLLQPINESFIKPQATSDISSYTEYQYENSNRKGSSQSKTSAEFACIIPNMEKISSTWGELQRHKFTGENHFSNSLMGNSVVHDMGAGVTGKQRIRWTLELHEHFVEAVNNLGGAIKATPKGILRLMKSQGLTIFHIKSHLQKYRTATANHLQGKKWEKNRS